MSASNETPSSQEPTFKDVAETSALLIALGSAWLYLAGWTYAYHYFDQFRIPLLMVDMPLEHYFVYGAVVLRYHGWWVGLILVVVLVLVWLRDWLPVAVRRRGVLIAAVITLLLFWLSHAAGVSAAHGQFQRQRATDYAAYPRVQIWRTAEAEQKAGNALAADNLVKGCYRLLLYNQDRLFLFRSFKGAAAADLPTVILPWSEIAAVRVLPDYTSCP